MPWSDWLPDFKGALKGFYEENLKETLESKSSYYEKLLKDNIYFTQRTQKVMIALGVSIFLLLMIAYFWNGNSKYFPLGVLTSCLLLYIYDLSTEK